MKSLLLPVFDFGVFLAGVLPPKVGDWLCRRGGDAAFFLAPKRRRITTENMAGAIGRPPTDPEARRLAQESFRNYGSYLYETVRYSHISTQEMLAAVTAHDVHYLEEALARGKGVIFVSAHFGSAEMAAVTVANRVAPMTIAGTALEPPELMAKIIRQRAERGVRLSVYASAARDVLMALKRNETVGFLVDLGPTWNGNGKTEVEFFGRKTHFPAGVALLAMRTGAAIVPGYAVTRADGGADAYALPAIIPLSTGNKDADAQECMQRVAWALEVFIAKNPEQWFIFRPMWDDAANGNAAPSAAPGHEAVA